MNQGMQIIREVSATAETDAFYGKAEQFGRHAAHVLRGSRSQLTGLENIAESTLKTTDILDYIKKQTARYQSWQRGFPQATNPNMGFGEGLKQYFEKDLRATRDAMCNGRLKIGDKTDKDKLLRRRVYLLLMRQFIRQMVIEYEYSVSQARGSR
ncbi:MAG TPA: hypothetical protein VKV20_04600 [Ktedonobacteraceae bacterium]|jgi:hypothetical protein|nr:hypothetical protein [Ktedonobacteraceae bacterium]